MSFLFYNDAFSIMENTHPETFELLGGLESGNFLQDRNRIYWGEKELTDADTKSFNVLSSDYAKDKNNVYYANKIVEEVSPQDVLTITSIDSWLDNKSWYDLIYDEHIGSYKLLTCTRIKVSNLPVKAYYLLNYRVYYAGSSKNYCGGEEIENADPESFTVINERYSKDKNYVYLEGQPITQMAYINEDGKYKYCTKNAYRLVQKLYQKEPTDDQIYAFVQTFFESNIGKDAFHLRFAKR